MKHKASTVALARKLHDGGMNVPQICTALEQQGIRASRTTVRRWVDDDFAARRSVAQARADRKYARGRKRKKVDELVRELREAGLSYPAISFVLGRYHGVSLGAEGVRYRCVLMGLPVNENKAKGLRTRMGVA